MKRDNIYARSLGILLTLGAATSFCVYVMVKELLVKKSTFYFALGLGWGEGVRIEFGSRVCFGCWFRVRGVR